MKKFLIVVDTQHDFMSKDGALYVPDAESIKIPGTEFLLNLDPELYEGVLFTYDTHEKETWDDTKESLLFPIHCVKNSKGWQNIFDSTLVPNGIKTYTLEKNVFSMWDDENVMIKSDDESVDRDTFFNNLKGKVEFQVFGVASDFCVKWTVNGLIDRDFDIEVIESLCRGINDDASKTFNRYEYSMVKLV